MINWISNHLQRTPVRVAVALHPVIHHAVFAYSSLKITELAKKAVTEKVSEADNKIIADNVSRITNFIYMKGRSTAYPSCYIYRAFYERFVSCLFCNVWKFEFWVIRGSRTLEPVFMLSAHLFSFINWFILGCYLFQYTYR